MEHRLTKEQRQAIVEAYSRGDKVTDIAQRFGVHHTYPSLLARRRKVQTRYGRPNERFKT